MNKVKKISLVIACLLVFLFLPSIFVIIGFDPVVASISADVILGIIYYRIYKKYFKKVRFDYPRFLKIDILVFILVFLSSIWLSKYVNRTFNIRYVHTISNVYLYMLFSIIIAPVFEEILFRGIVFSGFRNIVIGSVISSVIFTVFHFSLGSMFATFLFGLFLCYIYVKYGLKLSIVMHGCYNVFSIMFGSYFLRDIGLASIILYIAMLIVVVNRIYRLK